MELDELADERLTDAELPLHEAERLTDAALASGARALSLALPSFYALEENRALHLVALATGTARDLARLALEDRALVVATETTSGATWVEPLLAGGPPRLLAPTGLDGGGPPGEPRAAKLLRVEIRDRLGMPWSPGRYALRLVAADWASGVRVVAVGASRGTYDLALARHLAEERARVSPPRVSPRPDPAGRAPCYQEVAASPPIPAEQGITLGIDRVVDPRGGAGCLLHGAFRLPVQRHQVAPPGAIVPITLLVTSSEDPSPVLLHLSVPSYDTVDADAVAAVAAGHFTVDLFASIAPERRAETLFVSAFAGDFMAGPKLVALVPDTAAAPRAPWPPATAAAQRNGG